MVDSPRHLIDSTLVPHTAFEEASARLEQCYRYAEGAAEPICVAVIGESRTGKSRVLEECFANHPHERTAEGLSVPILRVKTPSKPTVKGLAELMLRAMNDPRWDAGTENVKGNRLQVLIRNAGTRMVMIDEAQHFYDKGSRRVMFHASDWLKILVDDCRVALVISGLPDCCAVIEQNEQLAGRFMAPVVMPRFDWKNANHRDEFVGILEAFQGSIGQHFDMPRLDAPEMVFRCYCGTGGLIGYLTKFLRQAVWMALDAERSVITFEDLALAHDKAVWAQAGVTGIANPFDRTFNALPSEDLLSKIRTLGTPVAEEVRPRRVAMRDKRVSLRAVLSAS